MLRQLEDLKTVSQEGERAYKATVSELETLRSKVSVQDNKIEELVSQLNDLTDHRTEMGKSLTSKEKKMASTMKQNKDLEKEVKTLRTKLEKETKATRQHENELSKLREDLDRLAKSKDVAENSLYNCQEEMKNVREQCEHDQEAARLALEKAEEMKASAEKEKQKALALTDCQLAEMMATLDTYKQNNEKLIAEKDAEVKSLLARVDSANSLTSRRDKELSEQKKEIDQLKAQIDLNRNEKDDLTWQFREKCDENRELRQRINELESKESKSSTPNCAVQKLANRTPSKLCTPILTSAVSDQEPSKRQSRLSTPRASVIPLKQCPETPASTTLNYSLLKTPQRSILRAYNSVSKRRRVTILAHGKSPPSSSEESDLMELDTASAVSLKACTPLLLKSPAKTRTSEKMDVSACTPSRIPLSRSSANSVVKQKMQETQEKEACAELYPSQTYEKVNDSDKSTKLNDGKHLNVRKTPAKKTPRIFSTSPRNKTSTSKTKLRENTKGESDQMAWFELDSVYGFGPED